MTVRIAAKSSRARRGGKSNGERTSVDETRNRCSSAPVDSDGTSSNRRARRTANRR